MDAHVRDNDFPDERCDKNDQLVFRHHNRVNPCSEIHVLGRRHLLAYFLGQVECN